MIKNLTENLKKKKGFTLIELIIVVAIIAILVGLAIPKLMGVQQDSKIKTDIANAKTIADATATLITQDKLTLAASGAETTINLTEEAAKESAEANATALKGYLQTVPVTKAVKDGKYIIKIQPEVAANADGKNAKEAKIAVFVGAKEIYPGDPDNYGK